MILAQRLLGHVERLELGRVVQAAFSRLAADEALHVELANEVLGAIGEPVPPPQALVAERDESPWHRYAREVTVGLFVCEAVSASRFAAVWGATDLPAFHQRIGIFLRDEVAHAGLGVALLPVARDGLATEVGAAAASRFVRTVIAEALTELHQVVAGGVLEADLPPRRAQPRDNPGVVEPAADARAFYRAEQRLRRVLEPVLV